MCMGIRPLLAIISTIVWSLLYGFTLPTVATVALCNAATMGDTYDCSWLFCEQNPGTLIGGPLAVLVLYQKSVFL